MKKFYDLISPYSYPGIKSLEVKKKYEYLNRVGTLLTPDYILEVVSNECGVTIQNIKSPSRKREYVIARTILTNIFRNHLKLTLKETGEILGNRKHDTIINQEKVFLNDYKNDYIFKTKTNRIYNILNITL